MVAIVNRSSHRHSLDRRETPPTSFGAVFTKAKLDPSEFVALCFTDPAGNALRQGNIHKQLQRFLSRRRKALIEMPRDHGKSLQICARVVWELGRNPGLRIKVVCATEGIAAERGRFIRDTIANNWLVRAVFPNLRPGEPWSETRFTIERPADVIGPSVTALGVGAGLTGTRADLLICDDIVDVKSMASRAERQRAKAFFRDNLMNLLEPDGRCWCLFTPWHIDDLNAELKRNGAYATMRRAVTGAMASPWPERWTRRLLEERRAEIGAASFARGYRLAALSEEETPIRREWIQFWDVVPALRAGTGAEVPSRSAGTTERIVLSIDPAVSEDARADASALVVLGQTSSNEIRCLEAIARRMRMPELVKLIDEFDRRWDPEAILFESNAAFKGIEDLLVRHARFGPKIRGIAQSRSKAARVEAFSVQVQNGTFRLKGLAEPPHPGPLPRSGGEGDVGRVDPGQQALFDEMTTFPVGEHDDLLDAAATGTEYLLSRREPRVWSW